LVAAFSRSRLKSPVAFFATAMPGDGTLGVDRELDGDGAVAAEQAHAGTAPQSESSVFFSA
jgi:hypothetical protein